MTYSLYNLTKNVQLSVRESIRLTPDNMFTFGVFLGKECVKKGVNGIPYAYEVMDWSEAVKMAQWILEENEWIQNALKRMRITSVGGCER